VFEIGGFIPGCPFCAIKIPVDHKENKGRENETQIRGKGSAADASDHHVVR
jgi:hypothetical protein